MWLWRRETGNNERTPLAAAASNGSSAVEMDEASHLGSSLNSEVKQVQKSPIFYAKDRDILNEIGLELRREPKTRLTLLACGSILTLISACSAPFAYMNFVQNVARDEELDSRRHDPQPALNGSSCYSYFASMNISAPRCGTGLGEPCEEIYTQACQGWDHLFWPLMGMMYSFSLPLQACIITKMVIIPYQLTEEDQELLQQVNLAPKPQESSQDYAIRLIAECTSRKNELTAAIAGIKQQQADQTAGAFL